MLIGELSLKTGLSKDTIRFYEKQGLIQVGRKQRRKNNYKEYSEDVLNRLQAIKRMKNFGFTLNEAATLLGMIDVNAATCDNVSDLIAKKVDLLDTKIHDMISLRNQLIVGVQKCQNCCNPAQPEENCPILVSDSL
ncbi:MerR family transcriptional regulator [Olivibacter sp. 47]|uniref:MerR family transcriptional regulator n=1 Tax=Olivibacter sp. 47 TaxID=3056486 RepID=UPI0025A3E82D|nr:MerR family transcriptional regulator [Olivibacter sp. 47]MDM8172934.1 MerR family transcriptional regulator [Olivibacter sp. 47]